MAHRLLSTAFRLLLASSVCIPIVASTPETAAAHIRTTDSRLRGLVNQGARSSPTFRALVERIDDSDVVVYLRCDLDLPSSAEGRLTFVSSVGGYRYLLIRLRRCSSSDFQLAIIGHELQHAVEIANAPAVVDSPSLAREYRKIGYDVHSSAPGIAFDSDAAVRAGHRVLRELATAAAD